MPTDFEEGKITEFPVQFEKADTKIKAAIVDDDVVSRMAVRRLVDKAKLKMDIQEFSTIEPFAAALENSTFDLVFLDFMLPDGNGLDALRAVTTSALNASTATIMIATLSDVHIAVTALKHGCSDYIVKEDLSPATLRRAVHNGLQKADLRNKVDQAAEVLARLQMALKRHAHKSVSEIRPLIENTLKQVSSMHYLRFCDRENDQDARIEVMELACKNMLMFCDEIERAETIIENAKG